MSLRRLFVFVLLALQLALAPVAQPSAAASGGSFGDAFKGSFVNSVVALGLADVQTGIGDVFAREGSGGEGSLGHVLLHGLAGCVAAEAQGADCAAGAAGGIAQAVYAGTLQPNMSAADREGALNRAQLVGAFAGYLFSGGKAENVSIGAAVAQSGLANNYLTHDEIGSLRQELSDCAQSSDFAGCRLRVLKDYIEISETHEQQLAACTSDQCRADHLARIAVADGVFNDILFDLNTSGYEGQQLAALQYQNADQVDWTPSQVAAFNQRLRSETASTLCSGSVSSCDMSVRAELEAWGALSGEELATLNGERVAILADLERQARAEIGRDVCSSGMSAGACSTAIDAEIERQRQNGNRIGGAIDLVFGGAEIFGSVYLCGQSAGAACTTASLALAAHGADTSIAGARALITGEGALPVGTQLLMRTGLSETQASLAYDLLVVGFELNAVRAIARQGDTVLRQTHQAYSNTSSQELLEAEINASFQQNRKFWSSDPVEFSGNRVFQRNDQFDPQFESTWTHNGQLISGTNLERMASGRAPIGKDGNPINLHHMTQTQDGSIAEVAQTFHTQNYGTIHINTGQLPSGISRTEFNRWREQYWQSRAATYGD